MITVVAIAGLIAVVVVANLLAQRVMPTSQGDAFVQRLGYSLLVRAIVVAIVVGGLAVVGWIAG